jgi:hypothetical protein
MITQDYFIVVIIINNETLQGPILTSEGIQDVGLFDGRQGSVDSRRLLECFKRKPNGNLMSWIVFLLDIL